MNLKNKNHFFSESFIRFSQFKRLVSTQPFFVWHSLELSRLQANALDLEQELGEERMWDLESLKQLLDEGFKLSELPFAVFKWQILEKLTEFFREYMLQKAKAENKSIYFLTAKSTKEKIIETQKVMQNESVDIVVEPVFCFKNALSNLAYIDKTNSSCGILLFSTSTKRNDLLKVYWNWQILSKTIPSFKVHTINFVMLKSSHLLKKGEVVFCENPFCNTTNTYPKLSSSNLSRYKFYCYRDEEFFKDLLIKKMGQNKKGSPITAFEYVVNNFSSFELEQENFESYVEKRAENFVKYSVSILPFLKDKIKSLLASNLSNNKDLKKFFEFFLRLEASEKDYVFQPLETYIERIEKAKEWTAILPLLCSELRFFRPNHSVVMILERFMPEIANFSGYLLPTKTKLEILEAAPLLPTLINDRIATNFFHTIAYEFCTKKMNVVYYHAFELEKLIKNFQKAKKIVWFDFESLGFPLPAVDFSLPFQQVPTQLSFIVTHPPSHSSPVKIKNYIFDPLVLNYTHSQKIIDLLFEEQATYYVVFNHSYEETKLREAVDLIYRTTKNYELLAEYREKFFYIKERIFDIQQFFFVSKIKSESEWEPSSVFIPALRGKYGIKAIEKFLSEFRPTLVASFLTPYKELSVQNGSMAMMETVRRALGECGNNEWQRVSTNLKKYCENDVKAMIMVFSFIRYLTSSSQQTKKQFRVWEPLFL